MKLNLLVIRTDNIELLKQQYELLGFSFDYHQHGKGPFHYASEAEGLIFEIYPLSQRAEKADSSLRLGFEVPNLSKLLLQLEPSSWKILSEATQKPWSDWVVSKIAR